MENSIGLKKNPWSNQDSESFKNYQAAIMAIALMFKENIGKVFSKQDIMECYVKNRAGYQTKKEYANTYANSLAAYAKDILRKDFSLDIKAARGAGYMCIDPSKPQEQMMITRLPQRRMSVNSMPQMFDDKESLKKAMLGMKSMSQRMRKPTSFEVYEKLAKMLAFQFSGVINKETCEEMSKKFQMPYSTVYNLSREVKQNAMADLSPSEAWAKGRPFAKRPTKRQYQ